MSTINHLQDYAIHNLPEIIYLPEKCGQQKRRERRLAERKKKHSKGEFVW